jgi:futalosine hydrolase
MKILIVTATKFEAEGIIKDFGLIEISPYFFSNKDLGTDLLVTGIGIPSTIFSMFAHADIGLYDLVINLGIAGSFSEEIKIGTIVNIYSDHFGDIGLNTDSGFKPVFQLKFNEQYQNLINNGFIYNTSDYPSFFKNLPRVNAVTVNIPEINKYEKTEIETMEGAAFMMVCKHFKKNFIQIRGISNIIGVTTRENWDFKTPINNYTEIIRAYLKK